MLTVSQVMDNIIALQLLDDTAFFLGIVILFKLLYMHTTEKYLMSFAIVIALTGALFRTKLDGITDIIPLALVLYMYIRRFLSVQVIEQSIKDARLFNKPTLHLESRLEANRKGLALIEPKLSQWVWVACMIKVVFIIMEY